MGGKVALFELNLIGPFHLRGPSGRRVNIASKKAQALLALLSMSGNGERTRSWLQTQLWGNRAADQAQASLRNELSSLRAALNTAENLLLQSDKSRVWLDLSLISIDAREIENSVVGQSEFLEGLDIPGEDGFEEWLREERSRTTERAQSAASSYTLSSSAPSPLIEPREFSKLPALAILPFANLTGDAEFDFVVEGISEDLIDRMSRLRWLPIIARSSSFRFRGESDPKFVGNLLGARYLLEGRLRRETEILNLTVSLTDSETDQTVWTNKLGLETNTPGLLDDMLTGLCAALGIQIDKQEQSRALCKTVSDLNVRELIWRGRWHLNQFTKEDSDKAQQLFTQALDKEPNSPEALIQNLMAKLWAIWAERRSESDIRAIRKLAQKAIIADLDDARGHMVAGITECWLKQPVRSESLLRHAISLNPSLVLAYAQLGSVMYLNGAPGEAIELLNFAVKLSPNDYSLFYSFGELAMAHLMNGDYVLAAEFAQRAILRRSAYWYGHVIRINANARSGEIEAARAAFADLRMSNVQFKEDFIDWLPFVDHKWNIFLKDGLNLVDH